MRFSSLLAGIPLVLSTSRQINQTETAAVEEGLWEETQIMSDNGFVVDESFNPMSVNKTVAQAVPIEEVKPTHEFRPDIEGRPVEDVPVTVRANENDQDAEKALIVDTPIEAADAECKAIEPTVTIVPSTTPVVALVSTTRVPRMHRRCVGVVCVVRKPSRGCIRGVTVSRRTYYVPYCI